MSQRTTTVYTCDLCGKDIADLRKKASYLLRGPGGDADVGPCCSVRTIAELVAAINKRATPVAKAAP